jgi:protein-tyrosine phosphatase
MYFKMMSMDEIIPGVFLGNYDQAENLPLLERYKITHILNVANGLENCFPNKFVYRSVQLDDNPTQNIAAHFQDNLEYVLFRFIEGALQQGGKVFVHCLMGVSRSATAVIAFVMWKNHLHFREAYALTKQKHSDTGPNPGFIQQLRNYQQILVQKT